MVQVGILYSLNWNKLMTRYYLLSCSYILKYTCINRIIQQADLVFKLLYYNLLYTYNPAYIYVSLYCDWMLFSIF